MRTTELIFLMASKVKKIKLFLWRTTAIIFHCLKAFSGWNYLQTDKNSRPLFDEVNKIFSAFLRVISKQKFFNIIPFDNFFMDLTAYFFHAHDYLLLIFFRFDLVDLKKYHFQNIDSLVPEMRPEFE